MFGLMRTFRIRQLQLHGTETSMNSLASKQKETIIESKQLLKYVRHSLVNTEIYFL